MEEIKFITINTESLWNKGILDNLFIGPDGIRLKSVYEYKFLADIINDSDLDINDIAIDECGILYIIASTYLFSWDEIPGNESLGLIDFLRQKYGIDWVKTAKIEKIDDVKTIKLSIEKNYLSLKLNDEKTEVNLEIDDGRINKFIVRTENGKLNIYRNSIFAYSKEQDDVKTQDTNENILTLPYLKMKGNVTEMGCMPGVMSVNIVSPTGIGIDKDTIYIAESGRISALARNNLQVRWMLSESKEGPLDQISDISADFKGNIYALETGKNRIMKITRSGRIERVIEGGLSNPTDITIDEDGFVYVLDKNAVSKDANGTLEKVYVFDDSSPKGLDVDEMGNILTGTTEPEDPTLYWLEIDKTPLPLPFPLWCYRDTTRRLINDPQGNLYVINGKGNKLTFLEYAKVNQDINGAFSGTYTSFPIDSHDPKNRWHRFLLEGEFPKSTQVEFSYFISDELRNTNSIIWKTAILGTSSIQGEKIRDVLFQEEIEGRYLWFRINLTGTELLSPAINSVKIFFPRTTYVNYLPDIYQENPASRDFLERYLSIFESIFSEIEYNIEHISRFFDAIGTPPEFLSWLSSWLSIPEEESFSENMKRLYIQKAISLYTKRGTKEGLEETIAYFLYTKKHQDLGIDEINAHYQEEKPFIIENFRRQGSDMEASGCQCARALYLPPDDTLVKIKKPDSLTWDVKEEKVSERLMEFLKLVYGSEWVNKQNIKLDDANMKVKLDFKKIGTEGYYNIHVREENIYLFSWDEVPGNDSSRLKEFLSKKYKIDWVKNAKIDNDGKKITLTYESDSLSLEPDIEKMMIILIFDERRDEFILKNINGKLNMYESLLKIFESVPLSDVLFGKERFSFCVFLKVEALNIGNSGAGNGTGIDGNDSGLRTLRRIIEEQKPAHTCYGFRVLEPWFYLDMHTYLEVNTFLTKFQFIVGKTSVIGRDMVLDDPEQSGQIERHSRTGIDTRLT